MITVLYVNHNHSTVCGIYDLGLRHAELLSQSTDMLVCYAACNSVEQFQSAHASCNPDVVIINFRADLMPWVHHAIRNTHAKTFAVIHNYEPRTVDAVIHGHVNMGFDYCIALDPGLVSANPRLWTTGRPIPEAVEVSSVVRKRPIIGSFGFAFPHKNFHGVAKEINDCCDAALFTLHMPEAYFNGAGGGQLYTQGIVDACAAQITKRTIDIHHTSDFIGERALVRRLAENDVNCLFYVPGQPDAGISSALDYLIAARKPILVSDCAMFSYARERVSLWPVTRLSDILGDYDAYHQRAIDLYDEMAMRVVHDTEAVFKQVLG